MAILDLFAGMGGWDEGLRRLGRTDVLGLEIDGAACQTRAAAGHKTEQCDVAAVDPRDFGPIEGLIASPPCTDFSKAGRQAEMTGKTGPLMYQVPRWASLLRPEWIACEQVPPAKVWYEGFAGVFDKLGYSTWVGTLNAADYGVPQTRKRVFLLASKRLRALGPPTSTHFNPRLKKHPEGTEPWVTMATALGWGAGDVPAATVTGGGVATGGAEPIAHIRRFADNHAAQWVFRRPSTTIVGSFRPDIVAPPTYRKAGDGPRQNQPGAIQITIEEGLTLQSFSADYPVQGSKTKQWQQVGNAVCPHMAEVVLAPFV